MPTAKKNTAPKSKPTAKAGHPDSPLTVNQAKKLLVALSTGLATRAAVSAYLGKSFSGDRDLYTALGYTVNPTYENYLARYKRQDIARAIVDAPVRACWRDKPDITESEEDTTKFEEEWVKLVDSRFIYHFMSRCDRLCSIGQYAILLLGFDDSADLQEEVGSAKKLLYLMPYGEDAATIHKWDENSKSERYGKVSEYSINISVGDGLKTLNKKVHWSRVIHVSLNNLSSDVYGLPVLEPILNRLQDIELLAGGSAEMFWRGAFPGLSLKVDDEAVLGKQSEDELEKELQNYLHGLQRYLRLQGINVEAIEQQIADPSPNINILIDLIAAAARIPKRVLMGSERGELASTQDEKIWAKTIDERRQEHCEAMIIRPTIDRLIKVGVLPEPSKGYTVDWPDILTSSDKEKAEVGQIKSKALRDYVDAIGAPDLLPPSVFYRKILNFTTDEIEQINEMLEQQKKEADLEPEPEPEPVT